MKVAQGLVGAIDDVVTTFSDLNMLFFWMKQTRTAGPHEH